MGCETVKNPAAEAPLWSRYAHQFPVRDNLLYLNHAAVSPIPRVTAEAMQHLADDALHWGSLHYREWLDVYDGVRVAAAQLINATPAEIALVKNTSEGIAIAAMGLDWKPGDRIVGFREEFPANLYPWKRLEAKGVEITWLSVTDPLDRIDEAARGAKLLAISFVQFLSGYRAPIKAIGEICKRNRCIFLLDAIQGMGAFPLDVRACHIDIAAADGHKWMMGPEGCGILYINQAVQDRIEPVEFGWTNVANYADYGSRDMTLWPDARRYECGTLNTIGCFGLKASLEFILEVGPGQIGPVVQDLGDRIASGVHSKGYEVLGNRTPENGAGIVSFRKAGTDPAELVAGLRAKGIVAAPRAGWVRTAPHFYIAPEEIDRLIDALP
jgi:selenocysteine lyase/cysteine desulfurase